MKIQRALLSVSDKTGLVDFARALDELARKRPRVARLPRPFTLAGMLHDLAELIPPVAIRTAGGGPDVPLLRSVLGDLDPDVPMFRVRTMAQLASSTVAQPIPKISNMVIPSV